MEIDAVPLTPSTVAVTVAFPAPSAVTRPELVTLAEAAGAADQATTLPLTGVPDASRGVATSRVVSPSCRDALGGVTTTEATTWVGGGLGFPEEPVGPASPPQLAASGVASHRSRETASSLDRRRLSCVDQPDPTTPRIAPPLSGGETGGYCRPPPLVIAYKAVMKPDERETTPSHRVEQEPTFRIRTFGGLGVERGGAPVESLGGQRKRLALLALLAVGEREPMAKDRILALLWPESDVDQARNALNQLAFGLRRELGAEAVVGVGGELRLNPAILGSDYGDFQRALDADDLERAAACHRGRFLDGFYLKGGAKEFEEWVETEARRQSGRYQSVLERLAERATQSGDRARVVEWRRKLAATDPLSARFTKALIEALVSNDEREAAIRQATAYIALVRAELDAEPDTSMLELVSRLREGPSAERVEQSAANGATNGVNVAARPSDSVTAAPDARPVHARAARGRRAPRVAAASAVIALSTLALLAWYRRLGTDEKAHRAPPASDAGAASRVGRGDSAPPRAASSPVATPSPDTAPAPGPAASRVAEEPRRVLIASLDNETGDSSLANVGVLASEWIAQGVQQTGMVNVVDPPSTLAAMRRRTADTSGALTGFPRAALMARDADADVVVWGAVSRQSDSLIFRARLSDVRRGTLLATIAPIASPLSNPMRGAARLRARIAGALAARSDPAYASVVPPSSPTPTFEAYAEYMAGLGLFRQFKPDEARRHFAAAFALDTSFATPLVWSALSFDTEGNPRGRDSVAQILAGRRDRGLLEDYALDYFQAEQHKDRAAMLIAARGAARLTPGSHWSHYAGSLALSQNRLREASHWFAQIDPERWVQGWSPFWESYMTTSHLLGEFDTEAALARRGLALGADDMSTRLHVLFSLIGRGRANEANAALDDIVRAMSAFNQNNVVRPAGPVLLQVALEFRAHGFTKEAAATLERAERWFRSPEAEDLIRTSRDSARLRIIVQSSLASTLYEAGHYDESSAIFAPLSSADPETSLDYRGLIAARRGDRAGAEASMASLDSLNGDPYARALAQARILCALGESERAMRKLEFAVTWQLRAFLAVHRYQEWDAARTNLKTSYDPERSFAAPAGFTQRR